MKNTDVNSAHYIKKLLFLEGRYSGSKYGCLNIPGLSCLNIPHLSCLNIPGLSCLNIPHLSCLNIPGLSCLNIPHLSCLNIPGLSCFLKFNAKIHMSTLKQKNYNHGESVNDLLIRM